MQEIRHGGAVKANGPTWYQIYFAAILESDHQKAAHLIERAQGAIRDRLSDLRFEPANNPCELQDLGSAFTYLGILLDHIGNESGSLLWD